MMVHCDIPTQTTNKHSLLNLRRGELCHVFVKSWGFCNDERNSHMKFHEEIVSSPKEVVSIPASLGAETNPGGFVPGPKVTGRGCYHDM